MGLAQGLLSADYYGIGAQYEPVGTALGYPEGLVNRSAPGQPVARQASSALPRFAGTGQNLEGNAC